MGNVAKQIDHEWEELEIVDNYGSHSARQCKKCGQRQDKITIRKYSTIDSRFYEDIQGWMPMNERLKPCVS